MPQQYFFDQDAPWEDVAPAVHEALKNMATDNHALKGECQGNKLGLAVLKMQVTLYAAFGGAIGAGLITIITRVFK